MTADLTCLDNSWQPPLSWYFDEKVLQLEKKLLFDQGPGYVGHESMVPARGDFHTLPWTDHTKMLVNAEDGISLLSNICRHRQAIMFEGKGNRKSLVCPFHHWAYRLDGTLLAAPHFSDTPCLHLRRTPLQSWNGLLFSGPRDVAGDLADLHLSEGMDLSGYHLDRVVIEELAINWKTFIEVYQENYHVAPFHAGLGKFVACRDLTWVFGERHSLQAVGINSRQETAGTPTFQRLHDAIYRRFREKLPRYGAVWFIYYPNVMIEWYPHYLVISTIIPRSANHTTSIVEFYYSQDVLDSDPEFIEIAREAYLETAAEDVLICERIQRGRLALYEEGRDEAGPYQPLFEQGTPHFHDFLRKTLGPHLSQNRRRA